VESLEQVIKEYGYIVTNSVRKIDYINLPAVIDKSDLEQEGYIELMRCWEDYSNDGRAKFSTYAYNCIGNKLKTKISNSRWGPCHAQAYRRKKSGKKLILDMISYDSFAVDGEPRAWIDTIGEERGAWSDEEIRWPDRKLLSEIRAACYESLAKDKYLGIYHCKKREHKTEGYSIILTIMKCRLNVGQFPDKEQAAQHKQDVIRSIIETIDHELLYAN